MKLAMPGGNWTRAVHADLMIMDAKRPWSPIDAVEAAEVGGRVTEPIPGRVHLVQWWLDPVALKGGHTALIYAGMAPEISPGLIIEATDAAVAWIRTGSIEEKAMYRGKKRKYRLAVLDI